MPPKVLPTYEEPTAQTTDPAAHLATCPTEHDKIARARLQLSVGAAAAELAVSLGLSDEAQSELIEKVVHRPVNVQLVLRNLFDTITTNGGVLDTAELVDDFHQSPQTSPPIEDSKPQPIPQQSTGRPANSAKRQDTKTIDGTRFDKLDPARPTGGVIGIDSVGQYLQEIGRYPLLTAEDEVELAGHIAEGRAASQRLAEAGPNYSPEQRAADLALVQRGAEAKNRFIVCNLRLAVSIAKRYQAKAGTRLELLDLIQEANIILEHAVDKFDASRGFKFSTYATYWIKQSIGRGINKSARPIRIADHKIDDDIYTLGLKKHRDMTDEELCEELGWEPEYIEKLRYLSILVQPTSFDKPIGEDEAVLGDFIPDNTSAQPYEDKERQILMESLFTTLGSILTEEEMEFLYMRSGLGEQEKKMTFAEIGAKKGTTGEGARKIYNKVIAKLNSPENSERLGHFRILLDD